MNIQSSFESESLAHLYLHAIAYDPSTSENQEAMPLGLMAVPFDVPLCTARWQARTTKTTFCIRSLSKNIVTISSVNTRVFGQDRNNSRRNNSCAAM